MQVGLECVACFCSESGAKPNGRAAGIRSNHMHREVADMSPPGVVAGIVGGIPIDNTIVVEVVEILVSAIDTHTVVALGRIRRDGDGGVEGCIAVCGLVDPQQLVVFEQQVLVQVDPDGEDVMKLFTGVLVSCVGGDFDGGVGVGLDVAHEIGVVAIVGLRGGNTVFIEFVDYMLPATEFHTGDTFLVVALNIRRIVVNHKVCTDPHAVACLAIVGAHIDVVVAELGVA